MTKKELRDKIKRLKNLKQYKNLSDEELEKIAIEKLRQEKEDNSIYEEDEKEKAEKRLEEYKAKYHIEDFGEIEELKHLVYLEILHERTQRKIAEIYKLGDIKEINSLTKTLLDIENNISSLRKNLGILEEKKDDSAYEYVQKLKKKFKRWLEEEQASRHIICPHCSKQILLKIRTDAWEARKHPFFKDRILYNEHLLRLYLAGIISAEDIGLIFGITKEPDYINWLIEKWVSRPDYERLKKEAYELRKKKLKEIRKPKK